MDGLKTDDFASLLAALGRSNNNSTHQMFTPSIQQQQPVMMPVAAPAPVAAVPVTQTPSSSMGYILVIGLLCLIIVGLAVYAWMKNTKMKAVEDVEQEEEEESKNEVKEIPPPSAIKLKQPPVEMYEDFDEDYVSSNILKYATQKQQYVDLSGFDLPEDFESTTKYSPNKKIVADESEEVLEYAKKRDALFESN